MDTIVCLGQLHEVAVEAPSDLAMAKHQNASEGALSIEEDLAQEVDISF